MMKKGYWFYDEEGIFSFGVDVNALARKLGAAGYTELYLSTGMKDLLNPALPYVLGLFNAYGIRVEALFGDPKWVSDWTSMTALVKEVMKYNEIYSGQFRFAGVHLDIEPWQGTGADTSWVMPLVAAYEQAKDVIRGGHVELHLSADMAGAKFASLTDDQRRALAYSLDSLVLMQYQAKVADVVRRTKVAMASVVPEKLLVAIRRVDFAVGTGESVLSGIVNELPGIGGSALFVGKDETP